MAGENLDITKELENININDSSVNTPEPAKTRPVTIVMCLPGKWYSNIFLQQWSDFLIECTRRGIRPLLSQNYSSMVHYARMLCLGGDNLGGEDQKPFRGTVDYDFMLWIDSDVIFSIDSLFKLLESPHDVTAALYHTENRTSFPVVKSWDNEYFLENGRFEFLTDEGLANWKEVSPNDKYMKVEYSGMGFMLMKKGVMEKVKFPWFYRESQELGEKDGKKIVSPPSEDVSLCMNLKDVGVDVYVDTTNVVGHYKNYIV